MFWQITFTCILAFAFFIFSQLDHIYRLLFGSNICTIFLGLHIFFNIKAFILKLNVFYFSIVQFFKVKLYAYKASSYLSIQCNIILILIFMTYQITILVVFAYLMNFRWEANVTLCFIFSPSQYIYIFLLFIVKLAPIIFYQHH